MMKTRAHLFWTFVLIAALLASCRPKATTPDPNQIIRESVAGTLAAMPVPTDEPQPTARPSATPFSLVGIFCEYQFCIGHPPETAFFDQRAVENVGLTSSYSDGYLVALNGNLFLQLIWQYAPDIADPSFMLDTLIDEQVDLQTGNREVQLIRGMNVIYTPITSVATGILPFGGAAAWNCGDRVFAWKAYTPQAESAAPLFEQTLAKFTCGQ